MERRTPRAITADLLTARIWNRISGIKAKEENLLFLRRSTTLLSRRPEMMAERVATFADVILKMNETSLPQEDGPLKYLKLAMDGNPLPSLEEVRKTCGPEGQEVLEQAKIEFPPWANNKFRKATSPFWGMAIEGYGLFLGKKYGNQENQHTIRRAFVLAFESIALREHPNSALVDDIIDWMIEEKAEFPEKTQSLIEWKQANSTKTW